MLATLPAAMFSQMLKGRITDQAGGPVAYSTVYIHELRQGTVANESGNYELKVSPGTYTVTYQSLGYQPVRSIVSISEKDLVKDITLVMQYYQISEVRISATGEDPAYRIMRKAIGMAPYYLNYISYYKAEVYLKGNLVINKIPRLLQKSMKMESTGNSTNISAGSKNAKDEKLLKAGDSFLMETYNEIEFNAPDRYTQKVLSYNSTFPSQGNEISPMDFIEASFYQPVLADMAISPLSPNAFSHYSFKYLGATQQGDYTINKIGVVPKRKSQQLFEGTIYIIEDLWCLQSVDLTNENLVGKIRVRQIYVPVQDDIWMPVSHNFEINIGIIGFKADAGYGSSVKYIEVRPNKALQKPDAISTVLTHRTDTVKSVPEKHPAKSEQQISEILNKEKLTNRDMIKLSKLMKKESAASVGDSIGKNLEIIDRTKQTVDKDAGKRDSTYWARIRPIPLSEVEKKSLKISDSIKSVQKLVVSKSDTVPAVKTKSKSKFTRVAGNILRGHSWADTSGLRFSFDGLIKLRKLSFNPVDGFKYGVDFNLSKSWKNGSSLVIVPDVNWTFSRQQLLWSLYTSYSFDRIRHSQIFIRSGVESRDINTNGGINTLINTFTSLFLKQNYLKLYESRYFTLGYSGEISNGFRITLTGNFEKRNVLQNNTNFSILQTSKVYSDNTPVNSYLSEGSNAINQLTDQKHFDLDVHFTYTPFQKYRMHKGTKIPAGSDWPTFELTYRHGINDFSEISQGLRRYDMIKFEVSRSTEVGAFGNFKWRIRSGGYFDNRNITFYDFFHVNSQPFPLMLNNYEDAFMLPSFYALSTPEFFGELHLKYTSPYLLLKLLPGLSNTLMRENLSLSYLGSRYHLNYTEIGYSISEIFFMGELGVYAGFNDLSYKSIGIRAVLNFR